MSDEPAFTLDEGTDECPATSIADMLFALPGWDAEIWIDDEAGTVVFRCVTCGDQTAIPLSTYGDFLEGGMTIHHSCRKQLAKR